MADLPTRLDLFAEGRDYVVGRATKIDPNVVNIEGSDVNVFVGSTSVTGDLIIKQLGYAISRLFLAGCEGDDLDRYAWDRYQETRKGASPAVGSIRLVRPTAAVGSGTVPTGTKLITLAGTEYVMVTDAAFGPSDVTSVADVRAVQAGKATQVGANQIRRFAVPSAIFDKSIQVTNDETTAGGEDVEDDETFRNRLLNFWRTARRGVLSAIEFGALKVPGVVSAVAIEALTGGNQPARVVNLYIADSSGVASQSLARSVLVSLEDFRAGGIAVIVSTSIPQIVSVVLKLAFQANVDTVTLASLVRASIVELINSLPVNGTLTRAALNTVLQRFVADGLIANDQSIVSPVGDLVPDIGSTLRTTLANVVVNV